MILDRRVRHRAIAVDAGARAIADYLGPRLGANDRIWVWGWHLWGVYAMTGHLSGSRVYKSFSVITQAPENTWRLPGSQLRFVPGPPSVKLIRDLQAHPPAFIVLGGSAPHRQFLELRTFLREHYIRDRKVRVGRVEFWQRR